jgi:glycogen operon protein
MNRRDWDDGNLHSLGVFLNGDGLRTTDVHGEPIRDDSFILLFNAFFQPMSFTLPPRRFAPRWTVELTTAEPKAGGTVYAARGTVPVESRSLLVLRRSR